MTDTFVLSLGGSLIVPEKINIDYLKKFKVLIDKYLKKGYKFIIVTGGGKTCRTYQEAARNIVDLNDEDSDWIGINATRINGELVRSIFADKAYKYIIKDPTSDFEWNEQILVAAGWKPGFSSDMDAVLLAKKLGANTVINLSNIDYAYDKDPNKFSDAKKLEKVSWDEFKIIVGNKWVPGMNAPFDPIASKEAASFGLKVIIANGKNLENLNKIFLGEEFIGTTIN